jgi:hypothetical protein
MARVSSELEDPEQATHFGALLDEPDDDLRPEERLEPKTIVIGGEPVRKGDKKPEPKAVEDDLPMRASPEPAPEDEGVLELKRQLSNQMAMTNRAAEVARNEHLARVHAERGLTQSNVQMVDQAIEAAKRDSEQARAFFQGALERGDNKGAADAQILISDARANLLRLMEMREGVVAEAQQQPQPQPRQAPQPQRQQYVDPAQMMQANVQRLSGHLDGTGFPKSAAWIRSHPEQVRDQAAIDGIDGAHRIAVNKFKLIPETDAYFDKIEEILEVGDAPQMTQTRQGQRQLNQSRMAAPARAEAPNLRTGRTRGTAVALTARQREHARDVLGMTDEEYAAEMVDAQGRGKLLGARS